MKTTREQHIKNEVHNVISHLQDAMLTASIQGRQVKKLDFTGNDLRLRMEGGMAWVFSAILNDDGKPVIEFAFSGQQKAVNDYSI